MWKTKLTAALAALSLSTGSMAATSVTGLIKDIQINKSLGNVIFIQLDAPHTAPISCHINQGWTYTLPQQADVDKKMFTLLLLARAMNKPVRLLGSGACSDFSAIESAYVVDTQD